MRLQSSIACVALTLSFATISITTATVRGAGWYNTPSNFCQCMGCGCGGGYHACLVMGPVTCDRFFACNERRLLYAPCATCTCWPCAGVPERPTLVEGFVSGGSGQQLKPTRVNAMPQQKELLAPIQVPDPVRSKSEPVEWRSNVAEPPAAAPVIPPTAEPKEDEPEKATSLIAPPGAVVPAPEAAPPAPAGDVSTSTPVQPLFDSPIQ